MATGGVACPNDMTKLDVSQNTAQRISIPTTWAFLAVGAWCLVAGLACITLGSYFKNLGLNMRQRVGFLVLVGLALALMGFGGLVAGMNHTKSTSFEIDSDAQADAAKSQTDPCDSS